MRISTEQDAWEFLIGCWHDPAFGGDGPLAFEGCALTVRLDPGDGSADWKTARAVNLLQHQINLTYLLAKRGTVFGRVSDFERESLGVGFRVEPGSTNIIVEIAKALAAIHQVLPAHLSMRARNIVAAGALVATVGYPLAHEYATYRTEIDKVSISAAATLEVADRTNRTNIEIAKVHAEAQITVAKVAISPVMLDMSSARSGMDSALLLATLVRDDMSNVVGFAVSDYVPWRPAFMSLAPYAGTLQWNDSRPVPARAAKAIAKTARAEATKQRRTAKQKGQPEVITTPWVTEVLRSHGADGAMRLGMSEA